MSDEDSFVILGTSPFHSLNNIGRRQEAADGDNISATSNRHEGAEENGNGAASPPSSIQKNSSHQGQGLGSLTHSPENSGSNDIGPSEEEHAKTKEPPSTSSTSASASLAASFILGEVDADVLKTSVFSQFPSISMEASAEDVVKLQNMMTEYIELKNTLCKVGLTMRRYFNSTLQWKEDINRMEQQYKIELLDCQQQMGTLRNENLELKRDVETKLCQMNMCDKLRQKDHTVLLQSLSEKSAQIENMRVQIEKLEQHQLASFEYIPKNENDSKASPDYVDRLEHTRIVKKFDQQLSELQAENLDLKDLQKQYIDEINCLQVKVVASEELIKQLYSDINLLKAKDIEKSNVFTAFESDRNRMKDDIMVLRQQVELYSKDFEMERNARQNIAGEKEQLLQDLRALQRINHELIENAQKQFKITENKAAAASTSVPSVTLEAEQYSSSSIHRCPVCFKSFKSIAILQSHVNSCLDMN